MQEVAGDDGFRVACKSTLPARPQNDRPNIKTLHRAMSAAGHEPDVSNVALYDGRAAYAATEGETEGLCDLEPTGGAPPSVIVGALRPTEWKEGGQLPN